jgi:5-methylthioadenosine/S-adenosylhomocysteine deaminase
VEQPQQIDLLIHGAYVVAFDEAGTEVKDAAIAIEGDSIVWVGPASEAASRFIAKDKLDASGLIAMPGFVDGHLHTAQQFLHGKLAAIRRRGQLKEPGWSNYLVPFEACLEPEDIYCSGLAAYASMISSGTTCFLEAGGPHPDEMGRAANEIGIRGRIALSTMDCDESIPAGSRFTTDEALKQNEALVKRWQHHPRVNAWLSLRQIMVNTTPLTQGMSALAKQLDTPIHTHLGEGCYEVDYSVAKWGLRPAEYMESIGALDANIHAAHSVLLSLKELDLYQHRNVSACHCPFNNYSMGVPRVLEMLHRGIRLALGNDGAATRGSLDMFEVVHAATVGQQAVGGTPYHIEAPITHEQMLAAALRGGSQAARLPDKIGSLEVGKLADLILVESDSFAQFPNHDPRITLAESTVGPNVRTVIIDGRIVMKDRVLLTVDLTAMKEKVASRYSSIMERYDKAIA